MRTYKGSKTTQDRSSTMKISSKIIFDLKTLKSMTSTKVSNNGVVIKTTLTNSTSKVLRNLEPSFTSLMVTEGGTILAQVTSASIQFLTKIYTRWLCNKSMTAQLIFLRMRSSSRTSNSIDKEVSLFKFDSKNDFAVTLSL